MPQITNIRKKLVLLDELLTLRNKWKREGHKVVFTNGCFDLIHLGHIEYLVHASELGEKLIIGLNSDKSVRKIKKAGRPIMDEHSRAIILAAFTFTDAIVLFDEETPLSLIDKIKPDVLVKGGDYKADEVVGGDIVRKSGGEVVIIPFIEGYSTTSIEEKIRKM